MTVPEARSKEYLEALLRDPDFLLVLDADIAAEGLDPPHHPAPRARPRADMQICMISCDYV